VQPRHTSELDRLLDRARALLGAADDGQLAEAQLAVNQALTLCPTSVDGWLLKAQVSSATGDDIAALAAVEMAQRRAPQRAECLYWRGAVLGDLGRHREALRAIESAFQIITDDDQWMLEDLYYEKAVVLEQLGLHDAAVAVCERGLRICPGSSLLRAAIAPAARARVRSSLTVLRGGQS
jgi:tetratricopeptide (TPR) repeat protein